MKVLSRIYNVHVRYSELFALRILLHNVKGPTCFEDVRTLDDGRVCKTFVEAARVRYLSSLSLKRERSGTQFVRQSEGVGVVHEGGFAQGHAASAETSSRSYHSVLYGERQERLVLQEGVVAQRCFVAALFDMFVKEMYDKGSESEGTKRARALYHIDSILRSNKLSNKRVGIDEVPQYCLSVFRIHTCIVKQLKE